ncbi:hypothetical protein P171DRAFT_131746 [Karstenula rhodostoma CBS 690.94]|uniref:Uncharacterized protein n=1 Tax=Karstenula rhodostoma CBS 690.94 TaxID=1392251 RepID=A0A9P4U7F3_9PLEO|nr:hypothetical protein P171DRAFT_131746 [Karstenula rhodostoma CBS 690.94]
MARCITATKAGRQKRISCVQWGQLVNVPDCRLCRGVDFESSVRGRAISKQDCDRPSPDGKTTIELISSSRSGLPLVPLLQHAEWAPALPRSPCGNSRVRMLALACSLVATAATLKGKREAWSRGPEGDLEACQRDGSHAVCSNVACSRASIHEKRSRTCLYTASVRSVLGQSGLKARRKPPFFRKRSLNSNWHVDRCSDDSAGALVRFQEAAKTPATPRCMLIDQMGWHKAIGG